jgi:hypothetical protein
MKNRRCRKSQGKTRRKCLTRGKHYCVIVNNQKDTNRRRCRKGTRRCADGLCHEK